MHFGCISSPKLSLLFVLKQLKRSEEAIKDFDKNFAPNMHDKLIATKVHIMTPSINSKIWASVHLFHVLISIHDAGDIIYITRIFRRD